MNPRLSRLLPYPFERLRALLKDTTPPAHLQPIGLQIGEPKHPAPQLVLDAICGNLQGLGTYPLTSGMPELRQTIARWLGERFGLGNAVDSETMVLPVNGTREALFAFAQAIVDPNAAGKVMMPNPFYQIYEGAALLAGAEPVFLNCDQHNDFVPDIDAVSEDTWRKVQILFLCSPGNPTGAVMDLQYLQRALDLADRYDFVIAADECYSEIYLDERVPPVGLLQAALASGRSRFERCMVFHSLSKRSSVPGLRSGFVAGDPALIESFLLYRTYHGSAMPPPTQLASMKAWSDERHVVVNRSLYQQKFARVLPILEPVMEVAKPSAGFYLWPKVGDDERFTRELFERQNVTVLPGRYLSRTTPTGDPGKGRVRISLVASVDECVEAARRIAAYLSG